MSIRAERSATIGETIEQLHEALRDYIEATYHISNDKLIKQRARLLDETGVIHQKPYIESTPRYKLGETFSEIKGLDEAALAAFLAVSSPSDGLPRRIYDPSYQHQAKAVRGALVERKSLMVMTGTGSGKTECFLLPILGKLASEARHSKVSFKKQLAVRAIVLYPMNALVNDQLGRLRQLFGDARIINLFKGWAGRPARFARYTSRTLYPGVRTADKDKVRLKPIGDYYVKNLEIAQGNLEGDRSAAQRLIDELQKRGKWPAKPDLVKWYGKKSTRWQDGTGAFKRCVTLEDDPELLIRHEVQSTPPDILVTNYSMLEYMLLRPIERDIFERTREWLELNPKETLLLVVDEAHLYSGAGGSEVALLIRRLRARLNIPAERLQVICTSASFQDKAGAPAFGARLTGKAVEDFLPVEGELDLKAEATAGKKGDAEILASVNLDKLYRASGAEDQFKELEPLLRYRNVDERGDLGKALYEALEGFPPMGRLINSTMQQACQIGSLGEEIFDGVEGGLADRALTTLMALGSMARRDPATPGLLPCRVHSFYRGLPGLWACMDQDCGGLMADEQGGPVGKLYGQPHEACDHCGARVFELYTCRNCGSAYARVYTDDLDEPDFLWAEAGAAFRTMSGNVEELMPLDILLEEPNSGEVEKAELDLITGRLNPHSLGSRSRLVYLKKDRSVPLPEEKDAKNSAASPGEFKPCGVCVETAAFGRTTVQDHQTKGDQPFQALITKQLQVQQPSPVPATRFAPLQGRKVLIFSDSRQTAARLAPNLQSYSTRDVVRPLIIVGYRRLQSFATLQGFLSLQGLYLAVLLAAKELGVRLRPELKEGESFRFEEEVGQAVDAGALHDEARMMKLLFKANSAIAPESLFNSILKAFTDQYLGLESLALATIVENDDTHEKLLSELPSIAGVADSEASKTALTRAWLRCWRKHGFWLEGMPHRWLSGKDAISYSTGRFTALTPLLANKATKTTFEKQWLPKLLEWFTAPAGNNKYKLLGDRLSLWIGGEWAYCRACRTTQRPFPGRVTCLSCGQETAVPLKPDEDAVFRARKGYYRASVVEALQSPPKAPVALVAAEHTAQLNDAQDKDVFSKAEEHELLFQDVNLGDGDGTGNGHRTAIDILSCTTTMEVGIDIGTLSGVALRNMPPARANYQQRAGRAGRRGNSVATVVAFGSVDSHDEHYFSHPDQMIRGPVVDPSLTLNNVEIAKRHVTAYLLQRYHQNRMAHIKPEERPDLANVFAVLGTVTGFKRDDTLLNRKDFYHWLESNEEDLKNDVGAWLPLELSTEDRALLLDALISRTLQVIDDAIKDDSDVKGAGDPASVAAPPSDTAIEQPDAPEVPAEPDEEVTGNKLKIENLLDRLLYKGVLPRYAFPTDVATFYIFDPDNSTQYRPTFKFTPSQGLAIALTQYAPGKQDIWVGGKRYSSGAIYSPIKDERYRAWERRKLYYECSNCHYALTELQGKGEKGEVRDCPACGGADTLGEARWWLRPPGFAHPVFKSEGVSPDDQPPKSYATRAKLTAPTPVDDGDWTEVNERLRSFPTRQFLLVSNRGPRDQGYTYCTKCGAIEPTVTSKTLAGSHPKPYPDPRDPMCDGGRATRGLVLGTDFITDILLLSVRVQSPVTLRPELLATQVTLRTLCEALVKAACAELDLEIRELQAEFRPALTPLGKEGLEVEIYLYDTLSGGAGFAQQVGRLGLKLFKSALDVLENCDGDCDSSCYRCLRVYSNKFDHQYLDRHLGAGFLRYLLEGGVPALNPSRIERSTELLYNDLERQGASGVTFQRNVSITVPGVGAVKVPILATLNDGRELAIDVSNPLTPVQPSSEDLLKLVDESLTPLESVDELQIRKNLPWTTNRLLNKLGLKREL